MTTGEKIRAIRKGKKLTMEELGAKIGVRGALIQAWETGRRNPTIKSLERLATALEVSVGDLYTAKIQETKYFDNPYWERICAMSDRQRTKGVSTYGQCLEMNRANILKRIEHLQEELIDGLMYCEWIKDKICELVEELPHSYFITGKDDKSEQSNTSTEGA